MNPFCAAVDWGTSSFRLWLIGKGGEVLAQSRSTEGMGTLIPEQFGPILETHLAKLKAPANLPVVVCGMAGARQGWMEARYCDLPASLARLAPSAVSVPGLPREVRIIPGLAQRDPAAPDVMRGEETQLLGAFDGLRENAVACMPGTHSKWVRIEDGMVRHFQTFMTGELYAAIRHHTILHHGGSESGEMPDGAVFADAVRKALDAPQSLTSHLFAIRAGELLGFNKPHSADEAISGLLIGSEIAAAKAARGVENVHLIASGATAARYGEALRLAGIGHVPHDADECVIAGLVSVARQLFSIPANKPDRKAG
jgi:2-dehydro-3-deoxygalactonokinase